MSTPQPIIVRACKYDGTEHRRWEATIARHEGALLVLDATFAEEIRHDLLGTIAVGTTSVEYYWLDRWYNVFRFSDPAGRLRYYYCNINIPPTFDGRVLSYVDLDTDILVQPDFSYSVLDVEEFVENAGRYGYPSEVRKSAAAALRELIGLIEFRHFPFDT